MVSLGGGTPTSFEAKFREFLQEPDTQDAIRKDQRKEMDVLRKLDDMEKLEELQGQREQLAVALQAYHDTRLLGFSERDWLQKSAAMIWDTAKRVCQWSS
mmetsp:Transcript_31053/g.68009  ORF Transcript_31053/g.68009 Transcript_31053/m.68009 type:complete len:100 (-) Transcript_31053:258-557(-)